METLNPRMASPLQASRVNGDGPEAMLCILMCREKTKREERTEGRMEQPGQRLAVLHAKVSADKSTVFTSRSRLFAPGVIVADHVTRTLLASNPV